MVHLLPDPNRWRLYGLPHILSQWLLPYDDFEVILYLLVNLLFIIFKYIGDEIEVVGYDATWLWLYSITSPFLYFTYSYSIPVFILTLLVVR